MLLNFKILFFSKITVAFSPDIKICLIMARVLVVAGPFQALAQWGEREQSQQEGGLFPLRLYVNRWRLPLLEEDVNTVIGDS